MAKRKKPKELIHTITSSETSGKFPNAKDAKRMWAIVGWENQAGGLNIDYLDSDVRTSGRMRTFDAVGYVCQQEVFFKVKKMLMEAQLGGNILDIVQNYSKAPRDKDRALDKAETKLDRIRKIALNIKTGKGGSAQKSDPYEIQKQLIEIINS